jgi:hypothetical protein
MAIPSCADPVARIFARGDAEARRCRGNRMSCRHMRVREACAPKAQPQLPRFPSDAPSTRYLFAPLRLGGEFLFETARKTHRKGAKTQRYRGEAAFCRERTRILRCARETFPGRSAAVGTVSPSPRLRVSACHSLVPPHAAEKDVHGRILPCSPLITSMGRRLKMRERPENAMRNARAARDDFQNALFLPLIPGNYAAAATTRLRPAFLAR